MTDTRKRVYLAGPLSSPTCTGYLGNVHRFIVVDRMLRRAGYAVFNPALDLLVGLYDGEMEYADYFDPNFAWIDVSDALYLIGHSPGADREALRAMECRIPVARSLAELHDYFDDDEVGKLSYAPDD